tara:strand:+ start:13477 stop:14016 length:540 start_codon:yes stop_codon:yes gene_type:complete
MEKSVNNIVKGETLLVSVKAVRGGKFQLEFAEPISNPNAKGGNSLVTMLNKSDDRFSSKARRAWISGEKLDIEQMLGISLEGVGEGQSKDLNVLNPEIGGERLRIQIQETTSPDDYQASNIETTAKKSGANGDFITHNGSHIFSNTSIVSGEAVHSFLLPDSNDAPVASTVSSAVDLTV